MPSSAAEFEHRGFRLAPQIANAAQIVQLKAALTDGEIVRAERRGQTYGARHLLQLEEVRAFALSPKIVSCLEPLLGPDFLAVRGLYFDKTERANWPVAWHQDLTLAVRKRCDLPGWNNWTVKHGVMHVQAPPEILGRMVTVRLHLDDCPAQNRALRLIPGSHCRGILRREQIVSAAQGESELVIAKAGDALFMRPLILHASSAAQIPRHRRVLHMEFAPLDLLPRELHWAQAHDRLGVSLQPL